MDKFIESHTRMAAFAARRSYDHAQIEAWGTCREILLDTLPKDVRDLYEAERKSRLEAEEPEVED